jgi:hypothetical protein
MSVHIHTASVTAALLCAGVLVVTSGCAGKSASITYDRVERRAFNQAAVRLDLPVFWTSDANSDGAIEPDEVVALLFYPTPGHWVEGGRFTPEFAKAYEQIVTEAARKDVDTTGLDPTEVERRRLVRTDLDFGIPTLVYNDLSQLPDDQQAFARRMLKVEDLVDRLYLRQKGAAALAGQVPAGDLASQSMFRRNQGTRGVAPETELNPACSAIPTKPKQTVDVYPGSMQWHDGFCAELEARPNAAELLGPFTVVREDNAKLVAVPYSEAYADLMSQVAGELRAAADELTDPAEDALRAYLRAAAQAFTDNDWTPADEAWAVMNARNSRWYLRVAPDEVYWEPCAHKAGFHMTFALINRDSLEWQDKLSPKRQEMEDALATLIGSPYEARQVAFQLPDFIDIVANAGDDRSPLGATIGQSLPNWGPVANEGRGRTVAMSNLYTDPDSLEFRRDQASSLLDAATMAAYTDSPTPGLLSTILHEASHNLGPAHEYQVGGRTDDQVFGGGLASVLEELKAQSAALWYVDFLRRQGLISDDLARQTYVDGMVWAFGHISRGMYTATGQRKAYSQLAAIQVGFLLEHGGLRFDPDAAAANGNDHGVFTIDFDRFPAAVEALMREVGSIKARGDRAAAEALCAKMVDGDAVPQTLITERELRFPKASFVYAVRFGG